MHGQKEKGEGHDSSTLFKTNDINVTEVQSKIDYILKYQRRCYKDYPNLETTMLGSKCILKLNECPLAMPEAAENHWTLTEHLLEIYPEFNALWCHRRLLLIVDFFDRHNDSVEDKNPSPFSDTTPCSNRAQRFIQEMKFSEKIFKKIQKSYAAWFHRRWILDILDGLIHLTEERTKLFQNELHFCYAMLQQDERNFHCWTYHSFILHLLEQTDHQTTTDVYSILLPFLTGSNPSCQQPTHLKENHSSPKQLLLSYLYDISTKMIHLNFSNYSAWHIHMKAYKEMSHSYPWDTRSEIHRLEKALYTEPYDESVWNSYHCFFEWKIQTVLSQVDGGITNVFPLSLNELNSEMICLHFSNPVLLSSNSIQKDCIHWYPSLAHTEKQGKFCWPSITWEERKRFLQTTSLPSTCWIGVLNSNTSRDESMPKVFYIVISCPENSSTTTPMSVTPIQLFVQLKTQNTFQSFGWWISKQKDSFISDQERTDPPEDILILRLNLWKFIHEEIRRCDALLDTDSFHYKDALLFKYQALEHLQKLYSRLSTLEISAVSQEPDALVSSELLDSYWRLSTYRLQVVQELLQVDPLRQGFYNDLIEREKHLIEHLDLLHDSAKFTTQRLFSRQWIGWSLMTNLQKKKMCCSNSCVTERSIKTSALSTLFTLQNLDFSYSPTIRHLQLILQALPCCVAVPPLDQLDLTGTSLDDGVPAWFLTSERPHQSQSEKKVILFLQEASEWYLPRSIIISNTPLAHYCLTLDPSQVDHLLSPYKLVHSRSNIS